MKWPMLILYIRYIDYDRKEVNILEDENPWGCLWITILSNISVERILPLHDKFTVENKNGID